MPGSMSDAIDYQVLIEELEVSIQAGEGTEEKIEQISKCAKSSFESRKALGALGACELVIKGCKENEIESRHYLLMLTCCCNLCGYCSQSQVESEFCTENIIKLVENGVFNHVINTLRKFMQEAAIAAQGLKAVRVLAYGSNNSSNALTDSNCEEAVVNSIKYWKTNPEICEAGCWAIMSLAYNDIISSRCGELGACELVYEILNHYPTPPESEGMIAAACWAIRNLSASNKQNTTKFENLNIVNSLLAILRNDTISELLFEGIAAAISGLCYNDSLAKRFGNEGVCDLLVNGLTQLADNVSIATLGCECIRNLSACQENTENVTRLMEAGAAEILVHILIAHRDEAEVTIMASRALGNLAVTSHSYQSYLINIGVADTVKEISDSYQLNQDPQRLGASGELNNMLSLLPRPISANSVKKAPLTKSFSRRFGSLLSGDFDDDDNDNEDADAYAYDEDETDDEGEEGENQSVADNVQETMIKSQSTPNKSKTRGVASSLLPSLVKDNATKTSRRQTEIILPPIMTHNMRIKRSGSFGNNINGTPSSDNLLPSSDRSVSQRKVKGNKRQVNFNSDTDNKGNDSGSVVRVPSDQPTRQSSSNSDHRRTPRRKSKGKHNAVELSQRMKQINDDIQAAIDRRKRAKRVVGFGRSFLKEVVSPSSVSVSSTSVSPAVSSRSMEGLMTHLPKRSYHPNK